jgi:hypothetical protein
MALTVLITIPTAGAGAGESHAGAPSGFSVGLRGGVHFAQHTGTEERDADYEVASEWRTGLTAGVFIYWPVTPRFGLQQEIVYTQKGSSQEIGVEILEIPTTLDVTYELDYVEIPVLMRLTWLELDRSAFYSLMGTALSIKIDGRYVLEGEVSDGEQVVPISADADLSEVDMFDFSFVYGLGYEFRAGPGNLLIEYRFTMSWNTLSMPTYAYVPFGDEQVLVDNDPVPLKNQTHCVTLGIRF